MKLIYLSLLFALLLSSCDDYLYHDESDTPTSLNANIVDSVHIFPDWDSRPPVDLTIKSDTVTAGETVIFLGRVQPLLPQVTTLWDFGDGAISTALRPEHFYTSKGTYTARFSASDPAGFSMVDSVKITVTQPEGSPMYGRVTFDDSSSLTTITVGYKKEFLDEYNFVSVDSFGDYILDALDHNYRYDLLFLPGNNKFEPDTLGEIDPIFGVETEIPLVILRDKTAPEIQSASPTGTKRRRDLAIEVNATDIGRGINSSTSEIYMNGVLCEDSYGRDIDSLVKQIRYLPKDLQDGEYAMKAIIKDFSGNADTTEWTFAVAATSVKLTLSDSVTAINRTVPITMTASNTLASLSHCTYSFSVFTKDSTVTEFLPYANDSTIILSDTTCTLPYTFPTADSVEIVATAVDANGVATSDTTMIVVKQDLPTAEFNYSYSNTTIKDTLNISVHIEDKLGTIDSVYYSIDGGPFLSVNPALPDTQIVMPDIEDSSYTCILRVIDNDRQVVEDTLDIFVKWGYPTAQFEMPYFAPVHDSFTIDASSSWDSPWPHLIVEYAWSLGQLDQFTVIGPDDSIIVYYTDSIEVERFPVVLRITDNDGLMAYDTNYIQIEKQWYPVGNEAFSSSRPHAVQLAIDSNDVIYTAFRDSEYGGEAKVYRYEGTMWESIGSGGYLGNDIGYPALQIGPDNTPWIAYEDRNNNKVTVLKFNGVFWEKVGTPDTSAIGDYDINLEFDKSGVPYIGWVESESYMPIIKMFNGTSWELVGETHFTQEKTGGFNMKFSSLDNSLWVSYSNYKTPILLKWTGTSWENKSLDIPISDASDFKMILDNLGTPHLLFKRYIDDGYKLTMLKYEQDSWSTLGGNINNSKYMRQYNIAISKDNLPYVTYTNEWASVTTSGNVLRFNGTNWEQLNRGGFDDEEVGGEVPLTFDSKNRPILAGINGNNGSRLSVLQLR